MDTRGGNIVNGANHSTCHYQKQNKKLPKPVKYMSAFVQLHLQTQFLQHECNQAQCYQQDQQQIVGHPHHQSGQRWSHLMHCKIPDNVTSTAKGV